MTKQASGNAGNDLFQWAAEQQMPVVAAASAAGGPSFFRRPDVMRRLALGFLAAQKPDGVAAGVPARFAKYRVAAAAFWLQPERGGNRCCRSALVEICDRRFTECADKPAILRGIRALREEREMLEQQIRQTEPHLADTDDLFSEYRTWHYERSVNPRYRMLRRELERLQRDLFRGSRLERIRTAGVADFLYLMIPAGELAPDEVAPGWGLLYIHEDGRITEERPPEDQMCDPEKRNHFALNIAAASGNAVLFGNGVAAGADGRIRLSRLPRRRRAGEGIMVKAAPLPPLPGKEKRK